MVQLKKKHVELFRNDGNYETPSHRIEEIVETIFLQVNKTPLSTEGEDLQYTSGKVIKLGNHYNLLNLNSIIQFIGDVVM